MWTRTKNLVVYQKDDRTEVYNERALRLNISRMKERLANEPMNLLTCCVLEVSIEHLEEGLNLLCNRV